MSVDLTKVTREDILRLCEVNLAAFALEFLSGPAGPPYFGEFLVGPHHQRWTDLCYDAVSNAEARRTQGTQVLVQASRDFGKSYFWTFAFPIWYAWRMQRRGIAPPPGTVHLQLFSATKPIAERLLRMIANEITRNPKLAELAPDPNTPRNETTWGAGQIKCRNGFIMASAGFHTAVRSGHPLVIILDDALTDRAKYSALQRQRDVDYFNSAIMPMLRPGGCLFVVGTPMHKKDLYAEKQKTGMFVETYTPAINEDGESNWPEVFPLHWIQDRRRSLNNEVAFRREYLLELADDLESYFPVGIFETGQDATLTLGESLSYYENRYGTLAVYHGVDLAMTVGKRSDWSVIFTYGLAEDGRRVVMNIEQYQTEAPSEQMRRIEEVWRKYGGIVTIESNQGQRFLGVDLRDNTEIPVNLHVTGSDKWTTQTGIPSLKLGFETGKWVWPADADSLEILTQLWDQFTGFRFVEGKMVSTRDHDDLAMALWIAEQARLRLSPGQVDTSEIDMSPEAVAKTLEDYIAPPDSSVLDDYFGLGVSGEAPAKNAEDEGIGRYLNDLIASQIYRW